MKTIKTQWLGRVEYERALNLQNRLVSEYLAGTGSETLLLLEHEPVYTIGRTRDQSSLRSPQALPHPVFEINRGGQATWHGPGQLVAYPILDLERRGRDLHRYMRFLEDVVIQTCNELGVESSRHGGTHRRLGRLQKNRLDRRRSATLGGYARACSQCHAVLVGIIPTHYALRNRRRGNDVH